MCRAVFFRHLHLADKGVAVHHGEVRHRAALVVLLIAAIANSKHAIDVLFRNHHAYLRIDAPRLKLACLGDVTPAK